MANLQITYLGLATTLIKLAEQSFLANPNFSRKILLSKRPEDPGILPSELPDLTALLVSDARYLHLDLFTYKYFKTSLPIFCPKGLGNFIRKFLPNPLVEIPPWSFHREGEVEIHAVPVRYRGYRIIPGRHGASAAFVLKSPQGSVFYSAGTGYSKHFTEIASLFDLDVAILPVGRPNTPWPTRNQQMTPAETFQAFQEIRAKHLLPIPDGWVLKQKGIFPELLATLGSLAEKKGMQNRLHPLKPGQNLSLTS